MRTRRSLSCKGLYLIRRKMLGKTATEGIEKLIIED
jgi:hypothetical protein